MSFSSLGVCGGPTLAHKRGNGLSFWPLLFRVELLGELVPPIFVGSGDFSQVVVHVGLVEMDDELCKWVTINM